MSINRSPVQFRADSDDEPACLRTFRALGLPPGSIVLEITEGVLLDGREANRERLARLRAAGIGLSLDDFGTGYASLAQLHAFEIDIVKIDRRFVSGLAEGNREQALCAGIISLAHSLGMKVTAEGVETIEQRDLLVGLGCDYAQGWLFGRPADAAAFEARLNGQQQG
jgi:EAL domain-containing protein (putative c-di-GMP-specific phosphodiesterase class I)